MKFKKSLKERIKYNLFFIKKFKFIPIQNSSLWDIYELKNDSERTMFEYDTEAVNYVKEMIEIKFHSKFKKSSWDVFHLQHIIVDYHYLPKIHTDKLDNKIKSIKKEIGWCILHKIN